MYICCVVRIQNMVCPGTYLLRRVVLSFVCTLKSSILSAIVYGEKPKHMCKNCEIEILVFELFFLQNYNILSSIIHCFPYISKLVIGK